MKVTTVQALSVEELVEKLKPLKDGSILLAIERKYHNYVAYVVDLEGEGFTIEKYPIAFSREEWADMLYHHLTLRPETVVICLNPMIAFIPSSVRDLKESFLV